MKHTRSDLKQMQSLPLNAKIIMTQRRIRDWYDYWDGQVYVSFSGGKDSTVLLQLVREIFPDEEAVFVNTGLEYPEVKKFAKTFENTTILRPKMRFDEVIKTYGYPVISKEVSQVIWYARKGSVWARNYLEGLDCQGSPNEFKKNMYSKYKPLCSVDFLISDMCCRVMKERPILEYEKLTQKKPITALMASESKKRETAWLQSGCNGFNSQRPMSKPMSFWTEQDVLQYIKQYKIPISAVYGSVDYDTDTKRFSTSGCARSGCIFCGYGCHLDPEPSRFQRLKETHPRQYAYCMDGGEYGEDGIWRPSKDGLGMRHVFDELNKIYGEHFIKYE